MKGERDTLSERGTGASIVYVCRVVPIVLSNCCQPLVLKEQRLSPITGYPLHRENRENGQRNSLSGKTQGIWKFCQSTGNLVCSSCKFPDSKGI